MRTFQRNDLCAQTSQREREPVSCQPAIRARPSARLHGRSSTPRGALPQPTHALLIANSRDDQPGHRRARAGSWGQPPIIVHQTQPPTARTQWAPRAQIPAGAVAKGHSLPSVMSCSHLRATPSSSLAHAQVSSAACFTSALAFFIATPRPTAVSISTSFIASPKAIAEESGTPSILQSGPRPEACRAGAGERGRSVRGISKPVGEAAV